MELNGHGNIIWAGWDELILEGLLEKLKFWVCGRLGKSNSPPKKEQSNRSQRTDYKNSTGYMIPTRFVGVSFYIKEAS